MKMRPVGDSHIVINGTHVGCHNVSAIVRNGYLEHEVLQQRVSCRPGPQVERRTFPFVVVAHNQQRFVNGFDDPRNVLGERVRQIVGIRNRIRSVRGIFVQQIDADATPHHGQGDDHQYDMTHRKAVGSPCCRGLPGHIEEPPRRRNQSSIAPCSSTG